RHTFDPYVITRFHAAPVYLMVAATLAALVLSVRRGWPAAVRRILTVLAVLLVVQAAIGYYQFGNGVPVLAVALHMAGAAALAAVVTMTVDKVYAVSAPVGDVAARPRPEVRTGR